MCQKWENFFSLQSFICWISTLFCEPSIPAGERRKNPRPAFGRPAPWSKEPPVCLWADLPPEGGFNTDFINYSGFKLNPLQGVPRFTGAGVITHSGEKPRGGRGALTLFYKIYKLRPASYIGLNIDPVSVILNSL